MLNMVCNDFQIEPVLQEINGEADTLPMPGSTFRLVTFGRSKDLPFSTLGFVIRMHSLIRGTQREYGSKPVKHSIVKRILVFKR